MTRAVQLLALLAAAAALAWVLLAPWAARAADFAPILGLDGRHLLLAQIPPGASSLCFIREQPPERVCVDAPAPPAPRVASIARQLAPGEAWRAIAVGPGGESPPSADRYVGPPAAPPAAPPAPVLIVPNAPSVPRAKP